MERKFWLLAGLAALISVCLYIQKVQTETNQIEICGYKIVNIYPHDSQAFTQGLVYDRGELYEGTGLNGHSSLRRVELATGKVLQIHQLDRRYFGEGITSWHEQLIQLTWQSQTGFVYNRQTFAQLKTFAYNSEGWGLTHDRQHLILSDGSDTLYFLDPETFQEVRRVKVHEKGKPIDKLNELEYINGEIFANVWYSNRIAIISPATGQILGWVDLTGLIDSNTIVSRDAVLNGIAYDSQKDRLFVTGKLWPELFEIGIQGCKRQVEASRFGK